MARGGIRAAALPVVALAAALAGGPAGAQEPLRLDATALDGVTAGAAKSARAAPIALAIPSLPSANLAELALKLTGQRLVLVPQPGGTGSTGGGKRSVTGSGSKSFKADKVTKPHRETLVVSGSAGR